MPEGVIKAGNRMTGVNKNKGTPDAPRESRPVRKVIERKDELSEDIDRSG